LKGSDKKTEGVLVILTLRPLMRDALFTQAIEKHAAPEKITSDGYVATHTVKKSQILSINVLVRTSKYLNNLIEKDHRRVKQRGYPMLGFKRFGNAAVTISGVELIHKIKKGQFDTSRLRLVFMT